MTCRHQCSNNHERSHLEVHQGFFLFICEHQKISDVSENRPSEQGVSSLDHHEFRYKKSCLTSGPGSGSRTSPSSERFSTKSCVRSPPAWRWMTTTLLAVSRPSCMRMQIPCLSWGCSTLLKYVHVNFGWWHRFQIFRIHNKKVHQSNSSRVESATREDTRKDF